MKLIIDIDKKEYNKIYTMVHDNLMVFLGVPKSVDVAIANGIPLDKIRAEIDSYCSDNRDRNDGLYIAMKIIDKYKAESEVEE